MQKWEYKTNRPIKQMQMTNAELNEWGEEGWELVGFVHASPYSNERDEIGDGYSYVFKRPKME